MTTAIAIPDKPSSALAALMASNPAFLAANEAATAGLSMGMHPLIIANAGRFYTKEGGEATMVMTRDQMGNAIPAGVLCTVVLAAKPELEKKLYLTAYSPGSNEAPDCMSSDGVAPDPGCKSPQAASCSGCHFNAFGSGVDQNGNATQGKRCADLKKLAVFANGKPFGFNVTPGSLKNFAAYVKDLSTRNIPLPAVMTLVGFDPAQPQIMTFTYGGMLTDAQRASIPGMIASPEVQEIINYKRVASAAPQIAAPGMIESPEVQEIINYKRVASAAPQIAAPVQPANPAPAPAQPATPAAPKSNRAPKAKPAEAAPAAPAQPDLGLGLHGQQTTPDLGLGLPATDPAPAAGAQVIELNPQAQPAPAAAGTDMSDGDIASMLGLPV